MSSLPDPQSQNPRNSAAIPVVLLNQIRQICPRSERLKATVVPLQTLIKIEPRQSFDAGMGNRQMTSGTPFELKLIYPFNSELQ